MGCDILTRLERRATRPDTATVRGRLIALMLGNRSERRGSDVDLLTRELWFRVAQLYPATYSTQWLDCPWFAQLVLCSASDFPKRHAQLLVDQSVQVALAELRSYEFWLLTAPAKVES